MPADPDVSTNGATQEASTLNAVREAKRLHPMTLLQRVLVSIPALVLALFPVLQSSNSASWPLLFMGLAYGLVALPAIVLQYLRFSYRITPNEIVIQSGVLNRKNRSIPVERIQNIQIEQSLVPRMLSTAKVKIETAGSASTEGVLEYVSLNEARSIRQTIRSFKNQQDASPGADAPATEPAADAVAGTLIFSMSPARVLLSGAFRFSLLYIAVIFSVFQFFPADDILRWIETTRGEVEGFMQTALTSPWLVGLFTIALAGFFGWFTGIAVNLNKYYGFRLWLDGDKLRLRRGLLTLAEGTIPLDKVQTLILRTNPLMRQFGWYALEVQTVGLDVEEQGHRVVVPFAQASTILDLAQKIRPFQPPSDFEMVSPLTIRRSFVRYAVGLGVVTALGVYVWPADWWAPTGIALPWWLLALLPALLGLAVLQYYYHGYSLKGEGFYVRRGVLNQYLWMTPTEKFHVFYTSASIFQRRLGLRTLFVDSAGAAASAYPEAVDLPADAASTLMARLYAQFKVLYARRIEEATGSPSARLAPEDRPALPEAELRDR